VAQISSSPPGPPTSLAALLFVAGTVVAFTLFFWLAVAVSDGAFG
jgi:hypothetical protein